MADHGHATSDEAIYTFQAYADADKEDSRSRGLRACFQDKAPVRLIRYSPVVAVP